MRVIYQSLVLINENIIAELIGPCYFYHKKLFAVIPADEIHKETQSGNCFRFWTRSRKRKTQMTAADTSEPQ